MTPAPLPVYTFLVNNVDYQTIYSQPLPDKIENVLSNLNSQAVYIPYINKPLKNGDVFTLYGKKAKLVYDMFIGKLPKVIEVLCRTDYIPILITNKAQFDFSSLPPKAAVFNSYKTTVVNRSGLDCSFSLRSFDSQSNSVESDLYFGEGHEGPLDQFILSVPSNSQIEFKISSSEKFYCEFSDLVFGS